MHVTPSSPGGGGRAGGDVTLKRGQGGRMRGDALNSTDYGGGRGAQACAQAGLACLWPGHCPRGMPPLPLPSPHRMHEPVCGQVKS